MLKMTGVASTVALLILLLLSEEPMTFETKSLLYGEDDENEMYGPTFHECHHEFAQASFIHRKDALEKKASLLLS
jgi:hypothetical protein